MKRPDMTRNEAESLAVGALSQIAGDATLLPRFLAITGIEASEIRRAAAEPGFLAGVLDFVLAHEPTLLALADASGVDPARFAEARQQLAPAGSRSADAQ